MSQRCCEIAGMVGREETTPNTAMNTIDTQLPTVSATTPDTSPFHAFYPELRAMAAGKIAGEARGHMLQATDLISETWLRLEGDGRRHWNDRTHFLSAAAGVMRNILIDQARRDQCPKHGGGWVRASETTLGRVAANPHEDLLDVDEALRRFAAVDPFKANLVQLRYFGGLTIAEVAAALGISEPTAKRHWAYARAWLFREITGGNNEHTAARAA